jgi:endonuclease YncB( thermonuclease family)
MHVAARIFGGTIVGLAVAPFVMAQDPAPHPPEVQSKEPRPAPKPQLRPHGHRVRVDPATITVEDGDTVVIRWNDTDSEIVRILGIDTPETRRLEHDIPYDQPFGPEARAFAQGALATANAVELLRAATLDPYDRTLAYLIVNGRNYSVLAIKAGYTTETVSHYGDNGLPHEAAEVQAAAKTAAPLPFEPPHQFRARMRAVSTWLKQSGQYPKN